MSSNTDNINQVFIEIVREDFKDCVQWLLRWDMIPKYKIKAFVVRHLYHKAIEATKKDGLKYGDKKQAIAEVQSRVSLSSRQIYNILKN
jgi:hypothetical protein